MMTLPWEDQKRWKDTSCACCESCWLDTQNGRCFYGGPFSGYVRVPDKGKK